MSIYKVLQVPKLRNTFLYRRLFSDSPIQELKKRKDAFDNVLPEILDSLTTNLRIQDVTDIPSWIKKVVSYNLAGGKQFRGLITVMTYEEFEKPEKITHESLKLSRIMGWCVEMLQTYAVVVDDIMDGGMIRRGLPAWHTLPNVGLRAINDSCFIYKCLHHVLRSRLGHLPQYPDLMNRFNDALLLMSIGQHLDYSTTMNQKQNFHRQFTHELYNDLAVYKTAAHTANLPIILGLLLSNNSDKKMFVEIEKIGNKIGRLFQIQDDFRDVFELDSIKGKSGRDIQEGKCTWLAVSALKHCNDAQRREFATYYGSSEPEHAERIKTLYEELNIQEIYRNEEHASYNEIVTLVNSFNGPPKIPKLLMMVLDIMCNRKN